MAQLSGSLPICEVNRHVSGLLHDPLTLRDGRYGTQTLQFLKPRGPCFHYIPCVPRAFLCSPGVHLIPFIYSVPVFPVFPRAFPCGLPLVSGKAFTGSLFFVRTRLPVAERNNLSPSCIKHSSLSRPSLSATASAARSCVETLNMSWAASTTIAVSGLVRSKNTLSLLSIPIIRPSKGTGTHHSTSLTCISAKRDLMNAGARQNVSQVACSTISLLV